jgi:hypothetical protein
MIKQYKPIKFGDGPDSGTVEGHRNRMAAAAETRRYNQRMKSLLQRTKRDVRVCFRRCVNSSSQDAGNIDPCAAQLELADNPGGKLGRTGPDDVVRAVIFRDGAL